MASTTAQTKNTAWSDLKGESYLTSSFFRQWKMKIIHLLLFPFLPIAVFLGLVSVFRVPILIIAFSISVIIGLLSNTLSAYLKIMKADDLFIDGKLVIYNGNKRETFLFCLKEKSLNFVTLGFYWLSGLNARALNKDRYSRMTRAGEISEPERSGFTGRLLHIIIPKIIVTAIPIIIMISTHLIPLRKRSELFWNELARPGTRLTPPNMNLWGLIKALARNGVSAFADPLYYHEVTTLLMTSILLAIALSLLIPWYRYRMNKWEVDNAVIDGYRLKYGTEFSGYAKNAYLNLVMVSIPVILLIVLLVNQRKIITGVWFILAFLVVLLLLAVLGYALYRSFKFHVRHTTVYRPYHAHLSWDNYMVSKERLNLKLIEAERLIFSPAERKKAETYFKRYWSLYALLALPMIYMLIFKYIPMLYIQIGFKQNNIVIPVSDVSWASNYGFGWIIDAFKTRDFILALRNTLMLNGLDLIIGFPAPIILAILLNELIFKRYKRITQTVFYMPHFLSWVIISSFAIRLFNGTDGLVNQVIQMFGGNVLRPFENNAEWVVMYILLGVWQSAGWGTIIYLAAISGISPDLYEAASIDGANRFRKIWHITLTGIRPTIIILLIMRLGSIIGSDFERPFALRNPLITEVSDVLSIYIFQRGIRGMQFPLTAAVGIFQSIICLIFLLSANALAKKVGERGVL